MTRQLSKQALAAGAAAALTVGFGIAGAAPASADQVWHQAVGRASSEAPCPGGNADERSQGWSAWTPSYAQWMNGGQGGWVCERSLTWAKDSTESSQSENSSEGGDSDDSGDPPDVTCLVYIGGSYWVSFASGNPIALPASVLYGNSGCTGTAVQLNGVGYIVSAADAFAAGTLCGDGYVVADVPGSADPRLFFCIP
jgi:hypothetical protein